MLTTLDPRGFRHGRRAVRLQRIHQAEAFTIDRSGSILWRKWFDENQFPTVRSIVVSGMIGSRNERHQEADGEVPNRNNALRTIEVLNC